MMSTSYRARVPMRHVRVALMGAGALALIAASSRPASAQMPTVDPSGRTPPPQGPPPATPGTSGRPSTPGAPATGGPATGGGQGPIILVPNEDGGLVPMTSEQPESGYYHYDTIDQPEDQKWSVARSGPVPELHVVRSGDTLWDLCGFYFSNPWEWPRVWSYNPSITNPHWIYPGDIVRLFPANEGPGTDIAEPTPDPIDSAPAPRIARVGFELRRLAFLEQKQLEEDAWIEGSVHERVLLTVRDEVFLRYPDGKPPKVGKVYAVYSPEEKVQHPDSGKTLGAYVRIYGTLQVTQVKKDKLARAVILEANDAIERGARVGPIRRTFDDVKPRNNTVNAQGLIVSLLGEKEQELIGERQIVFIDLGGNDKIAVGNRLFVIRRGDAFKPDYLDPESVVGQDDLRYPANAIGEVMVVDVGEATSMVVVVRSFQESEVGDIVLMRKTP